MYMEVVIMVHRACHDEKTISCPLCFDSDLIRANS